MTTYRLQWTLVYTVQCCGLCINQALAARLTDGCDVERVVCVLVATDGPPVVCVSTDSEALAVCPEGAGGRDTLSSGHAAGNKDILAAVAAAAGRGRRVTGDKPGAGQAGHPSGLDENREKMGAQMFASHVSVGPVRLQRFPGRCWQVQRQQLTSDWRDLF